MMQCADCGVLRLPDHFSKMLKLPWGLENYCNFCYEKQVRFCWKLFNKACREGQIIRPSTCSDCKRETKISGHHINYNFPYMVVWLCASRCHAKAHRAEAKRVAEIRAKGEVPRPEVLTDSFWFSR